MAANETNELEVRKALIVDDDEVARNLIANHFGKLGAGQLTLLEDGEAAWQALQKDTYDFIVLDWKLPKLSGLALFNRIRRTAAHRSTPILVVSGFLEKFDFRLLQEFPCTGLMEKPFTMTLFQNRVEELKREAVWYGQNVTLIDGVLDAVKQDGKKAEALLKQVLKKAPNPIPLAVLAARRMVMQGMLKPAEAILEGILKLDDDCVIAMNELGKVYHQQGRHKDSLDVLRRANKLSPQNLQRLCLTGEVELNMRDPENARAHFEKALGIDGEDEVAKAGVTVAENMDALLVVPPPMKVPHNFASLLNTMGITFVRNGQFEKGIEQYRAAMAFLHSKEDSARVAFNLGLGYLRWGKPTEALPWFQRSEKLAPVTFDKSSGYVKQLIMSGVEGVEEAPMAPYERGGKSKPADPQFGKVDQPPKPDGGGTLKDDLDEGGGKVIPFPVKDEGPARSNDDEIVEERVGTQVVLKQPDDAKPATPILDAEDFPDADAILDPTDDEILAL